jgi:Mycobacterium membrane protein
MVERNVRDIGQAPSDVAFAAERDVSQQSGRRPSLRRFARQRSTAPLAQGESRKGRRSHGFAFFKVLKRVWIPLIILVVMVAGGMSVSRLHGIFGSDKRLSYADTRADDTAPFNPKHLKYEVFGPPGTVADINYFDVDADPQLVKGASLPWSVDIATTKATAIGSIVAQGDSDRIGCRILVDGVVKAEKISQEVNAFTSCLLKAA